MAIRYCQVWRIPHRAYPCFDYFYRNVKEYAKRHENLMKKGWLEIKTRRDIKERMAALNGPITIVFVAATGMPIPLPKIVQNQDFRHEHEFPKCNYVDFKNVSDVLKGVGPIVVVYQFHNKLDAEDRLILKTLQYNLGVDSRLQWIFVDMPKTYKNTDNRETNLSSKRKRKRAKSRRKRRHASQVASTERLRLPVADSDESPTKAPRLHERKILETKILNTVEEQMPVTYDFAQLQSQLKDIFESDVPSSLVLTEVENVSAAICKLLEAMSIEVLHLIDNSLRQTRDALYCVPAEEFLADVLKSQMEELTKQSFANKTNIHGWSKELEANDDWKEDAKLKEFHGQKLHDKDFNECYFCGLLYNLQFATTRVLRNLLHHAVVVKTSMVPLFSFEITNIDPFPRLIDAIRRKFEEKIGGTRPYPRLYGRGQRHIPVQSNETDAIGRCKIVPSEQKIRKTRSIRLIERMLRQHGPCLASEVAQIASEIFIEMTRESRNQWVRKLSRLHWEVSGLLAQTKSQNPEVGITTEKDRLQLQNLVMKELLGSDQAVIGFGYFFGNFRVHVHNSSYKLRSQEVDTKISKILSSHGINDYEIVPVSKDMNHFVKPVQNYGVGDKITAVIQTVALQPSKPGMDVEAKDSTRSGTLGGLAEGTSATGNPTRKKTVCALVSHHVVYGATKVVLHDKGNGQCVEIGRPIAGRKQEGLLDIAAVGMKDGLSRSFHKQFMNSSGEYKRTKLFDFNDEESLEELKGRRVHIWGATTGLGRGVIASPAFIIGVEESARTESAENVRKESMEKVRNESEENLKEENGKDKQEERRDECKGTADNAKPKLVTTETIYQRRKDERPENLNKESKDSQDSQNPTEEAPTAEHLVPHHKLVIIADDEEEEDGSEDGNESENVKNITFSREGDSGSIIVSDEPDNENVLVLSMLIGKNIDKDHEYYTFRLVDGLQSLRNRTGNTFTLYDKD